MYQKNIFKNHYQKKCIFVEIFKNLNSHFKHTPMKKILLFLAASILAFSVNAQTVDYALDGFCDEEGNPLTTIALSMEEGLSPRVILTNNGPDVPAATDTVFLDIAIDGMALGSLYLSGADLADLTEGMSTQLYLPGNLLEASDMDQIGFTDFNFCYTVRIAGVATDPVENNNQACIDVTRGNVGIADVVTHTPAVYPNPASDHITVANAANTVVTIYDIAGKAVYSEKILSDHQTLDVSTLTQGLYIVRMIEGNNVITKKINIVK